MPEPVSVTCRQMNCPGGVSECKLDVGVVNLDGVGP